MPERPQMEEAPIITRRHLTRLRQIYRSSGWPCRDPMEVDLLVAGLLEAVTDLDGRETLSVTVAGLQALSSAHAHNRASRSVHNELVLRVAQSMQQEGRIAWAGLPLRARVNDEWVQAIPDVFSIRNTTVEAYLEPVVHEIKVSRADLLGDLKKPEKRAAYLGMATQVYYVLGVNAKGQPIAEANEIPPECGVMVATENRLEMERVAPRQPLPGMRFDTWMALAKSVPLPKDDDCRQLSL